MDRNRQTGPGSPFGSGAFATSGRERDLEGAWGSSTATAAPPPPQAPQAPQAPQRPQPPQPPQPPHAPTTSVVPTAPDVALPRPAPITAKRRGGIVAPWRLRGPEARRQMLLAGGFVVLAVLAALVVAVALSNDSAPEAASRVAVGPGGPNPFARVDDPVPALTENDSVLPPADAAQLPPDANATTTTVAPAQSGLQATSTPTPISGSGSGSTSGTGSAPAPTPAKTVTLVYSATPSDITINGNSSPKLNVGDTLVFKRAGSEAGAVAMAAPGSFTEARDGYDYSYTVTAAGAFSVTIVSNGISKTIPVTVG